MGNVGDNWSNHRNSKTTWGERLSNRVSDEIDRGGVRKRADANKKNARDAAEDMSSAPGGSTGKRGKHGASQPLTRANRKAADRALKAGKPEKKGWGK